MKIPQPFFRKQTQSWYLEINGQQTPLGKDKKKAFATARDILRERGFGGVPTKCTAHKLIDEFWKQYAVNRRGSTVDTREEIKDSLRAFLPAGLQAADIRPAQVMDWVSHRESKAKRIATYAPDTKRKLITFAQGIWAWGRKHRYIEASPLQDMEKPRQRTRQDFVPSSLFQQVITLAKSKELKDYITFMLDAGCRSTEMFTLQAKHFDSKGGRFILDIDDSKGNRESRVIYLPPTALGIAKRLCKRHPAGNIFRAPNRAAGLKGRPRADDTPWDKNNVNKELAKIRDKLNEGRTNKIKSVCGTALRHSYAHYRLSQGQDAASVAKLMGHKSTAMIYARYGHMDKGNILKNAAGEIRLPGRKPKKKKEGDDDKAA